MKFKLEMNCDNDAFGGGYGDELINEVSDILSRLAYRLAVGDRSRVSGNLSDSNGNFVGHWEFNDQEEDQE